MTREPAPSDERAAPLPTDLDAALAAELIALGERGRLRRIVPADARHADFCSNDALGLAAHPLVAEAMARAATEHGAGGRASRLLGGGGLLHAPLEETCADWLGAEAALLFPSGWHANVGLVATLAGRGDAIVSDAKNHASIVDACRLSRARVLIADHADPASFERALTRAAGARRRFVVTESVFSMDGDLAPLAALHDLCERHDAALLLDEAHAIGLLGPQGAGAWAALERDGTVPPRPRSRLAARVVTGGKALGVAGGIVCCGRVLRDVLVNRARSFVYTTAPPPVLAAGLLVAIDQARRGDDLRAKVLGLAARLADAIGLERTTAAIVPVACGTDARAVDAAAACQAAGFDVRAVRPPTVPEGAARLRLVAHAFNTAEEVDRLAATLRPALERSAATVRAEAVVAERGARVLFVAGTDTDAGKTVVSALLLRAALGRGIAAQYWKPVQTGPDSDTATVARLSGVLPPALPDVLLPPAHEFPLPASPHEAAAAAGAAIDPERLFARLAEHRVALARRAAGRDARLLVELAGGLFVPYVADDAGAVLQIDWLARERDAAIVLVARSGLGTLNHTLLSLEALRARRIEPAALFLVGPPHASNHATLAQVGGIAAVVDVPPFARGGDGLVDPRDPAIERWIARAFAPGEAAASALFGEGGTR